MDSPESELKKSERIDLGLALLSLCAKRGVELTEEDISVWCDCTVENIRLIQRHAMAKARRKLQKLAISPKDGAFEDVDVPQPADPSAVTF
jgi:hypothetical protein